MHYDMLFVDSDGNIHKTRRNIVHFIDLEWRAVTIHDNSINHFKAS